MDAKSILLKEENRRIRLLSISSDLLVHTLMTNPLSIDDANRMIEGVRMLALRLFPDKGDVFDLIYVPRFRRALRDAGLLKSHQLGVAAGSIPSSHRETVHEGPRH